MEQYSVYKHARNNVAVNKGHRIKETFLLIKDGITYDVNHLVIC